MAKEVTLYLDKKIPYCDIFFETLGFPIIYFDDQSFDISSVKDQAIVVIRSTYKTHNKKINSNIKLLCSVSTGEDHVDKAYLKEKGISYAFSTGANATAVAEYIFSSIALLLKEGAISRSDKYLVIGHGNIGSQVSHFFKYIGYDLDVYDPYSFSTIDNLESLDQYKLITLHVPLTDNGKHPTKNIVDLNFLKKMRNNTFIINTSRGGVVKEEDFLGQDSVKIISDVFENEPNINANFHKSTYISTPHIAGHSQSARFEMTRMAYKNILDFLRREDDGPRGLSVNKVLDISTQELEDDIKQYGFPTSLLLKIYNPKDDVFSINNFKNIRDSYNNRYGFNQISLTKKLQNKFKPMLNQLNIKTSYN